MLMAIVSAPRVGRTGDGAGGHRHRHELTLEPAGDTGLPTKPRGPPVQPTPANQTDQFGRPFTLAMNTEIAATSACG